MTMMMPYRYATAFPTLLVLVCSPVHSFLSTIHSLAQNRGFPLSAESKHPLILAGETLLSLNDETLVAAAQALMEAGNAWTSDWEQVTYACEDAAQAFRKLDSGFETIADELDDLSDIGGCTSVGPASSVPNLVELQRQFDNLAKETGSNEFKIISDAFGELAKECS